MSQICRHGKKLSFYRNWFKRCGNVFCHCQNKFPWLSLQLCHVKIIRCKKFIGFDKITLLYWHNQFFDLNMCLQLKYGMQSIFIHSVVLKAKPKGQNHFAFEFRFTSCTYFWRTPFQFPTSWPWTASTNFRPSQTVRSISGGFGWGLKPSGRGRLTPRSAWRPWSRGGWSSRDRCSGTHASICFMT